jgi:hypothetical protein
MEFRAQIDLSANLSYMVEFTVLLIPRTLQLERLSSQYDSIMIRESID